jgi:Uma2 family endonuclease
MLHDPRGSRNCKGELFSHNFEYAKMTGMATPTVSRKPVETVADLLDRLGNIPSHRVLLWPGKPTEKTVLAMERARRKRLCELVDGFLVEKAMGLEESLLALFLGGLLNTFVIPRNLGLVSGPDGFVRLRLGLVRIPDLAFVSWDRLPRRRRPIDPILKIGGPDLAVEVLSKGNTRKEMVRKRKEYFRAGTRLVWEIDPRKRQVQVFTSPDDNVILTEADTLTGGDVLPGFKLRLKELFAELDRHG